MSATLHLAAAKWARAVRDRRAAAAALRKAKAAARGVSNFSQERAVELAAEECSAASKKVERRAEKALLNIIEMAAGPCDDAKGVTKRYPLAMLPHGAGEVIDV